MMITTTKPILKRYHMICGRLNVKNKKYYINIIDYENYTHVGCKISKRVFLSIRKKADANSYYIFSVEADTITNLTRLISNKKVRVSLYKQILIKPYVQAEEYFNEKEGF